MRRITLWALSTITMVVLLFSYRTSTNATTSVPATAGAPAGGKTYSGPITETEWGPVQVVITVDRDKITDVSVPLHPTGHAYSERINARALPILRQATLTAQKAHIDTVSGATVTSNGYQQSLQAALDAAHLS